jgi:hypothetical protein
MSVEVYDSASGIFRRVADLPGKLQLKSVSDNYNVEDGYDTVLVTASSDKTVTLPVAANHTGRTLKFLKVDSGSGKVIVDPYGSETIGGKATVELCHQQAMIEILSDGSNWLILHPANGLLVKTIEIGNWDMDTNSAKNVAHGLGNAQKIRSCIAIVRPDSDSGSFAGQTFNLESCVLEYASSIKGGVAKIGGTNIELTRVEGTLFDGSDFDALI